MYQIPELPPSELCFPGGSNTPAICAESLARCPNGNSCSISLERSSLLCSNTYMWCSKFFSKIIVVPAAKLLIGAFLVLGKRPDPPVIAAEVASQPRPCWVAYPADARVVSLPDRTPWQPRYKAGRDGAESLDSRRPALSGRAKVSQCPCQSGPPRPRSGRGPHSGPRSRRSRFLVARAAGRVQVHHGGPPWGKVSERLGKPVAVAIGRPAGGRRRIA